MLRSKLPTPLFEASKAIFSAVEEVREKFKKLDQHNIDLQFTPGDRLIGDLGEALALYLFNLTPMGIKNAKEHDFKCGSTHVQVKATSALKKGSMVGLGLQRTKFDKLLVFKFHPEGEYEILYNGPGELVYDAVSSTSIAESTLRKLADQVARCDRLKARALVPKSTPGF
jgi:hypothetical protein